MQHSINCLQRNSGTTPWLAAYHTKMTQTWWGWGGKCLKWGLSQLFSKPHRPKFDTSPSLHLFKDIYFFKLSPLPLWKATFPMRAAEPEAAIKRSQRIFLLSLPRSPAVAQPIHSVALPFTETWVWRLEDLQRVLFWEKRCSIKIQVAKYLQLLPCLIGLISPQQQVQICDNYLNDSND